MGSATKSDRDSMSLVLDQMSEMQKMLRSVMEQVRNLEDKVEGLQKENEQTFEIAIPGARGQTTKTTARSSKYRRRGG